MIFLLIDNSQSRGQVGLSKDNQLIDYHIVNAKTQRNAKLLQSVEAMLRKNKITPQKLAGVVWVNGPGGFTGLRTAATLVNGFAYVHHIPVIAFNWLDVLASLATSRVEVALTNPRQDYFVARFNNQKCIRAPYLSKDFSRTKGYTLVSNLIALEPDILVKELITKKMMVQLASLIKPSLIKLARNFTPNLPLYLRSPTD
jgi:tRNA threonylcarbamoyl adenosine modification protein YeaZ